MKMKFGARFICVVGAVLALQAPTGATSEEAAILQMTPAQILKPADLTPKELDYYQKLTEPDLAKMFITTRSYVRLCQQVIDRKLPASRLPDKPTGFSVKYLLPGEANVINQAIAASIIAGQAGDNAASAKMAALQMTSAQMLKPADLSPKELDYYKKLTDPAAAKMFIETRSYVRLCQQEVDHQLPPLQLPDKPLGFSRIYLLPGEEAVVNQAASDSLAALLRVRLQQGKD